MAYKDSPNKQLTAGIGAMASAINPITGMPASANMGNMPPQPSNTMGNANPVFNNPAMAAAQGVFGSTQMRQNSVTPFQQKPGQIKTVVGDLIDETIHENNTYKSNNLKDKISGMKYNVENLSEVQEDGKGQFMTTLDQDEFYGGPRPTSSTVTNYDQGSNAKRDTLRPFAGRYFYKN
jgi:TolA-binding protein